MAGPIVSHVRNPYVSDHFRRSSRFSRTPLPRAGAAAWGILRLRVIALTTVVSTSTTSVCEPPTVLSILQRPVVITGLYLEQQVVPSARLMQHCQAAGFSKVSKLAAAPTRPSTNRMFDDRWLCFTNWATGKGFDPLGPTAAQIATFLYELFDTHGLSPPTIKRYRSCLASVPSRTGKVAEVQAKTISHMIMSM